MLEDSLQSSFGQLPLGGTHSQLMVFLVLVSSTSFDWPALTATLPLFALKVTCRPSSQASLVSPTRAKSGWPGEFSAFSAAAL
ncbi:MAG TPA: hypothetical protein VM943_09500 [Pyrinomonadaceae bacterium]|nr:hypothetical protein [Pyrinomonadaceae bacterium]